MHNLDEGCTSVMKKLLRTSSKKMKKQNHINHQTRGFKTPSSAASRRRHSLNKVMKIIMTFFALAVVGLAYWMYHN